MQYWHATLQQACWYWTVVSMCCPFSENVVFDCDVQACWCGKYLHAVRCLTAKQRMQMSLIIFVSIMIDCRSHNAVPTPSSSLCIHAGLPYVFFHLITYSFESFILLSETLPEVQSTYHYMPVLFICNTAWYVLYNTVYQTYCGMLQVTIIIAVSCQVPYFV